MVDDHTLEKISHSGKRISPETKSRVIFFLQNVIFFPECSHQPKHPQLKAVCFFIILNASTKEDFEFLLESVISLPK
jgi:hypothetical protein